MLCTKYFKFTLMLLLPLLQWRYIILTLNQTLQTLEVLLQSTEGQCCRFFGALFYATQHTIQTPLKQEMVGLCKCLVTTQHIRGVLAWSL